MARKPETLFRTSRVIPFLKTLKTTAFFPIQQCAIIGDPDFMLCCRGNFVALELKKSSKPSDAVRALQQFKLDQVRAAHGVAIVACPENWDEVKSLLLFLDQGAVDALHPEVLRYCEPKLSEHGAKDPARPAPGSDGVLPKANR